MAGDLLLLVHVLAVVVGLGATFAYPFMQVAVKWGGPAAAPALWRVQDRIDRAFVVPGLVVILVAGVLLVVQGRASWGAPFVSAGFLIVGVLLVLVLFVLNPGERRAAELAERDLGAGEGADGGTLSDEYWALSRRLAMAGGFASLLVVVGVVVMVLKPGGV